MNERHLSKSRTFLIAAGSVAAFLTAITTFTNLGIGSAGGGGGGQPR